ncbi:MAG: hypothetical protein EOO37_02650 [Cytophagaceae bacterium]|nr:MAG: hypothetical protein EOO37_02650 [Cytophagaceae bacterium]
MALSENAELEELIRRATGETANQPLPNSSSSSADEEEVGDSFDIGTLVLVARRSMVWVLLLLGLGFTASWLFLRYTKPVYKSASLLKLDERSEAANFNLGALKGDDARSGAQLAGEVELIKSNMTYQNLKNRLALDVNYYVQGTVLETEMYNTSPFQVRYKISDPQFYGRKFQVSFPNPNQYLLTVKAGAETLTSTRPLGQWAKLPGIDLLVEVTPNQTIAISESSPYFFVILNDGALNAYLDRNLEVTVVNPSANTIQISFTDNNPAKAAHIVNNIDTVYLKEKLDRKRQSSALTLSYINQVIADNDKLLHEAENTQQEFVRRNKTYDIKSEVATIKERMEKMLEERLEMEQKLRLLGEVRRLMDREQLTRNDDETVADNIPGLAEIEDPILEKLLDQLDSQQRDLRLTLKSQTEKTTAVQFKQLAIRETRVSLQRQLQQNQRLVQNQLTRLDEQDAKLNNELQTMPEKATQQARLQRPLDTYAGTYQRLIEQKMQYQIQQAGTTADFQILSPASPPSAPISPVQALVYAIGLASGLVLGLGLIATRYLLHNTVTSVQELERNTRASVLGVIPTYEKEKLEVSRLIVDKNPKSSVSEAIRSIRTNLDFISPATKKRIISITSTISGEGKTFVAVSYHGPGHAQAKGEPRFWGRKRAGCQHHSYRAAHDSRVHSAH